MTIKLRTRLLCLGGGTILLAAGLFLGQSFYQGSRSDAARLTAFRNKTLEDARQNLKTAVDIVFLLLEYEAGQAHDPDWLQYRYGPALQEAMRNVDTVLQPERSSADVVLERFNRQFRLREDFAPLLLVITRSRTGQVVAGNPAAVKFGFPRAEALLRRYAAVPEGVSVHPDDPLCVIRRHSYPQSGLTIWLGISDDAVRREITGHSRNLLRHCRYNHGNDYIFVISTDNICLVNPLLPHVEDTDISMLRDAFQKPIISEMVKLCLKNNDGFITYHWNQPRPSQPELSEVPKLGYIRLFKPWMWVIGSSTCLDGVQDAIDRKHAELQVQRQEARYREFLWIGSIAVLVFGCFGLILCRLCRPLEQLADRLRKTDPDDLQLSVLPRRGAHEIRCLGQAVARMLDRLRHGQQQVADVTAACNQAESELHRLENIHHKILPNIFPFLSSAPEFEITSVLRPASVTSGFCDCFRIDANHIGLVVANVSQPGAAGILYSLIIRTILYGHPAAEYAQPGELLTRLNRVLPHHDAHIYIALFFAVLDLHSGDFRYTNAGHCGPLVYRRPDRLEELASLHGDAIGVRSNHFYSCDHTQLQPGDAIMLYNAGLLRSAYRGRGLAAAEFRTRIASQLRSSTEETITQCIITVENMFAAVVPTEDAIFLALHFHGDHAANHQ